MTAKEESLWLEYRSKVTGKSIEELRQDMKSRAETLPAHKRGFASLSPEERKRISQAGVAARKAKRVVE